MTNTHKKSKLTWNFSVFIVNLMTLMGICFMIWFAISMIQCWMHHLDYLFYGTHYTYPDWNMFMFITKLSKGF